jgi:putative hydrolase of the HAD superfamily
MAKLHRKRTLRASRQRAALMDNALFLGSIRALVFDGDDTLWETQLLYDRAKARFGRLVSHLGLSESEIQTRIDEIDSAQVLSRGFSRHRFPRSLFLALKSYEQSHQWRAGIKVRREALKIGRAVFSSRAPVVRRARSSLRMLKKHFKLILVTKGDPVVQRKRIVAARLAAYFDSIYVVKDKTPATLRRILKKEGVDIKEAAIVGDSLRSDIHPALIIGATAVWIPSDVWSYEQAQLPRSRRFYRATSLSEFANELAKPMRC